MFDDDLVYCPNLVSSMLTHHKKIIIFLKWKISACVMFKESFSHQLLNYMNIRHVSVKETIIGIVTIVIILILIKIIFILIKMLRTLTAARSLNNSTSLITMYIPGSTKLSDLSKMITTEIAEASNIKSRQTRQGVQDALQSVSTHVKSMKKLPSNGVVIMTGETTTGFENTIVEPKRPIDRFFYRCDNKFWV